MLLLSREPIFDWAVLFVGVVLPVVFLGLPFDFVGVLFMVGIVDLLALVDLVTLLSRDLFDVSIFLGDLSSSTPLSEEPSFLDFVILYLEGAVLGMLLIGLVEIEAPSIADFQKFVICSSCPQVASEVHWFLICR